MSHFSITILILAAIILCLFCAIAYSYVCSLKQDEQDYIAMPQRKAIKPSKRSLWALLCDFWYYWRAGMSLGNAWERANRVI